jgi:type I restriction enzyme S subunit
MKVQSGTAHWFSDNGTRLDASFHLSEGRIAKKSIDKSPLGTIPLSKASKRVFLGGRFKRVFVDNPENGYPYLTASDMTKSEPFSGNYLSKKHTRNLNLLKIKKDWILISCSGSIGRTAFTNELFDGQIGTHDLIRVEPDPSVIPPGYLYAYLSSRYGFALLTQGTYGGVIQHIEPHHIAGMPIPILPRLEQQHIHELVEKAATLRVDANKDLSKAIIRLEHKLPKIQFKKQFIISSLEFTKPRLRLDATLQISAVEDFYKECSLTAQLKNIGEVSSKVFTPNIFKRIRVSNPQNGVPFLSGVNLLETHPKFDDFLSKRTPNLNDYILRDGWLAIQDSGSISSMGYVSLIPKFLDGVTATNNLIRVIPDVKNYNPYIYAFLKTQQGQQILKSLSYGTGQLHIDNNQIECLQVPIFQEIFEDVTGKVNAYKNSFNEAFELESMAIECIESAISSWQPN